MLTETVGAETLQAIKQRLDPLREVVDENVRHGRRMIVQGRYAVEDVVAAATRQVRKYPLTACLSSLAAGALAGCCVGFASGWRAGRKAGRG
jgi:hypothetical protein